MHLVSRRGDIIMMLRSAAAADRGAKLACRACSENYAPWLPAKCLEITASISALC